MSLARAYLTVGADNEEQQAIRAALTVDPTNPEVVWNAANLFLVRGSESEALQQFAVLLRNDPAMVTPSLEVCWRVLHDLPRMEAILPADPDVYLKFIKLLLDNNETDAANHLWSAMLQLKRDIDFRQALFYVDLLLQQRQVDPAREAWNQLVSRSPVLRRFISPDNLVVDGDFSQELLNGGFDWRYAPQPGTAVALDVIEFHSSMRSLKITYSDTGADSGVYQYVPVNPGAHYVLSGWVKSEELQSAEGPAVTIVDAYDGTVYARTDGTIGTTQWHRLEKSFRTGPSTKLVALRITRQSGYTKIRGRFWVDDLKLEVDTKATELVE
jgi:hypothetical protein